MKKNLKKFQALLLGCVCAFTTAFSSIPTFAVTYGTDPGSDSSLNQVNTSNTGEQNAPTDNGTTSSGIQNAHEGNTGSDSTENRVTLWIVGDSTAAQFSDTDYYSPRYGWGTQLGRYFQGIDIRNLAISGTSSKSYAETDSYQLLLNNMKSGDYLMIGFGHNDERAESGRYSNPNNSYSSSGSFQYYLFEKYIKPAKDKGAIPVLCTPIVRRNTGNNYTGESGHITKDQTTSEGTFKGGNYAKAIWNIGVAKSVPVLDLTARTKDVYERLGADGVKDRHAMTSSREASIDNTHTNLYGAQCNAWFIADELAKSNCSLKDYLVSNRPVPQFTDAALNAAYVGHNFTAPTTISSLWQPVNNWKGTVFGNIDGYEYLNTTHFSLGQNSDSSIRIAAGSGSASEQKEHLGKITQTNDGIAMYYQEVPANGNFVFSADVRIHQLDTDSQASFGLMVRDDVYLDTVQNDTLGDYVAAGPMMLNSSSPWNCFARKNGQLVGGGDLQRNYRTGDTVHIEIHKNADGYTCYFGDNPPISAGFDFPLTAMDSSNVYVGMFAAKCADVSFWNVNLQLQ